MIQKNLTNFAISRPKLVMVLGALITLVFLAAFPSLRTDTDPVHMLPTDNASVLQYDKIKETFNVNDIVGVGIRMKDGSSLFTVDGLTKIYNITKEISKIQDEPQSNTSFSKFFRKLQFLRDTEVGDRDLSLFDERDIISVSLVDDITKNSSGELLVKRLMEHPPKTEAEAKALLKSLNSNPMVAGVISSLDGNMVGIVVPMLNGKKNRSYYLSQKMQIIANKYLTDNEEFYLGGLPVAESTFGNEMFVQMGLYAPMAGLVIFLLMLYFFRSIKVVAAPMILGVMVVLWAMGALIYSGNVIHIMSSMIPIFLLPIAVLNSIHILSNLSRQMGKYEKKEDAIRHVMKDLFNPMFYTSLTTIIGFTALATTGIPPVIVFGVTIGFGVFLAWILSMLFIPAYTMLLSDDALLAFSKSSERKSVFVEVVQAFKKLAWNFPKSIAVTAIVIVAISILGVTKIIINDNPVRWFKADHSLRIASDVMNEKMAGTYMSNLYFEVPEMESAEVEDDFGESEEIEAPSIKNIEVIRYIKKVADFLPTIKDNEGNQIIGGVTSIVDVLVKINEVVKGEKALPQTREEVSQYMFLFESGDIKKGRDMWKLITPGNSNETQMWTYFKTGDNQNMLKVLREFEKFEKENPAPILKDAAGKEYPLKVKWSGIMQINNVWQDEMVTGMMEALTGSFVIVLLMMVVLFRSVKWAFIAMLPLTITILFIYGAIGFTGKFYDMPIAILSSLTLGLSIDFAIHFIEHIRMFNKKNKNLEMSYNEMFEGTAQAIWRNVLVISIGFLPLFFAGLVPYLTVGSFFFAIMLVSGITTLILMPAIVKIFYKRLPSFKEYI
ncbi:MAG: MMPL family transporter [Bacteriovoracaceae bacterium]|nr:MMPL family transporter [Bacteriovoracaceae bacterium]